MNQTTRKMLDRLFSGFGLFSVFLMAAALLILLTPIIANGVGAYFFKGTIEFRKFELEAHHRGDAVKLRAEIAVSDSLRAPLYRMLDRFDTELADTVYANHPYYESFADDIEDLRAKMALLFGPGPDDAPALMTSEKYGRTRWDKVAEEELKGILYRREMDYGDGSQTGKEVWKPRTEDFAGTSMSGFFPYLTLHAEAIMQPRFTFYPQFISDKPVDSHLLGGIWPEMLGTFYLTLGAMLFALPFGVFAAIYLTEFAREGWLLKLLRTFVSTLAGVPSIVFGLFGLAFFINTLHVSDNKSVLAGSMTLSLLILPTVIRAAEEAIRAVPHTYKEASLSLGASRWRTVVGVILPAALPGILTGVVISMGRAAGETAPIIFTAAVSVGQALKPSELFSSGTPALSWNIYNLSTEHARLGEIRHVQYGMVLSLIVLVLALNLAAILLRARISRKLRG
jgi:phosphate transport system permease protein